MPVTGQRYAIQVRMENQGQQCLNIWLYQIAGVLGGASLINILEAYWNHVSAGYRGLADSTNVGFRFLSVYGADAEDDLGEVAEYPVPGAQQYGTRSVAVGSREPAPSFLAAGVRLAVATRSTRPGQKRLPFLLRDDLNGQSVQDNYKTAATALLDLAVGELVLGAPALGVTLTTQVRGIGSSEPAVVSFQDVIGYAINPNATSQNSRKIGNGS